MDKIYNIGNSFFKIDGKKLTITAIEISGEEDQHRNTATISTYPIFLDFWNMIKDIAENLSTDCTDSKTNKMFSKIIDAIDEVQKQVTQKEV